MLTKKKFLVIWFIGFMSGFTLMISCNTLNFWLAQEGVNIKTIGAFTLVTLPYAINFLWAPILDTIKLPLLNAKFGQRISWLLVIQTCLSISVYYMSRLNIPDQLMLVAACGMIIAFFASTQDMVLGALKTEIMHKNQQGQVSGTYIVGYRIGMLLSSSGAIYISQYLEWSSIFQLFSIIIIFFPILLLLFSGSLTNIHLNTHPNNHQAENSNKIEYNNKDDGSLLNYTSNNILKIQNLFAKIVKIITPMGSIKYIILVLLFLVLYRLSDNFISAMINPFLLHIGYGAFEISTAGKFFGVASSIIGGFIASQIMKKQNLYDSLFIFGTIHAIAHILFIVQEIYGKSIYLLFVVTGFESVSGGMCMAAYIAFIASLCKGKFRATQYSFLSSMMGFSRSVLPALSGYIVHTFGWSVFFMFTTIATIPSLILILYLKKYKDR